MPEKVFGNKSMLLAEDNEFNSQLISAILEDTDIDVTIAGDGGKALSIAKQQPFDIILMDIHLPILNGIEVSRMIRHSTGPNATTPIIALTADRPAAREDIMASGINDILVKPFDERLFWNVVHSCLAGNQKHQGYSPKNHLPGRGDSITSKLLPKYYRQLPDTISEINQAMSDSNIRALRETLHYLKGSADFLSMRDVSQLIREVLEMADMNYPAGELVKSITALVSALEWQYQSRNTDDS